MDIAAGEYGYTTDYFRRMLRCRGRRCAAGRRDPLRRYHRLPAGRRAVRGASHRPVRPLRAVAASARGVRGAALAAPGMVSRPRAHRTHAVRRRAGAARRQDPPGPVASRARPRVQAAGRRAVSRMHEDAHDASARPEYGDGACRRSAALGDLLAALSACTASARRPSTCHCCPRSSALRTRSPMRRRDQRAGRAAGD